MKNVAVIFAGGTGSRMNNVSRPKQFIELNGKPVIIYTLELFENHPKIDGIVVVCLETWIDFLKELLNKFHITKVASVVPGGTTGQESIYNGLVRAHELYGDDTVVLIHDGVRPLITEQTITDNIDTVVKYGNCITCVPATETFMVHILKVEMALLLVHLKLLVQFSYITSLGYKKWATSMKQFKTELQVNGN